ncbi:MAG: LPXTG cell wall anchor domain-containing protein [Actinoallomurus sp.]
MKKVRGRVVHMARGQVAAVPRGGVPTGFGGSQEMSLPMGVAGLSLILGGTGLLARRRIRTGARS